MPEKMNMLCFLLVDASQVFRPFLRCVLAFLVFCCLWPLFPVSSMSFLS